MRPRSWFQIVALVLVWMALGAPLLAQDLDDVPATPTTVPHQPYMDDPKFQKALEQAKAKRQIVKKRGIAVTPYAALSALFASRYCGHVILFDTNGALKSEQVGSDADVRGVAVSLLKKAHKAEEQRAKASDKATSGQQ
jgi:hypothetical protein